MLFEHENMVCLFACWSFCLSFCLSVCLLVCFLVSFCLFVCLFVYLSDEHQLLLCSRSQSQIELHVGYSSYKGTRNYLNVLDIKYVTLT